MHISGEALRARTGLQPGHPALRLVFDIPF